MQLQLHLPNLTNTLLFLMVLTLSASVKSKHAPLGCKVKTYKWVWGPSMSTKRYTIKNAIVAKSPYKAKT